ncbi:grpE protein homolog 2, mitochondrial-like isoform X1 [Cucurbita pepo subsp. pepo]|uniref:grpE protein homolog 2, mitochondrial-like isoform X1 n=1 Tax=Cucurbita pepo subsp. pepo TaxID=3664 RepID=UPI000C9D92BC|nr:grpE protein homolog 2, mitochondrial-like isoform X1 [Cucurbita pepo subsp. pepo]
MIVTKLFARASRGICRSSLLSSASQSNQTAHFSPILSNRFHCLANESINKVYSFSAQESALHNSFSLHKFGLSTFASPETPDKENGDSVRSNGSSSAAAEPTAESNDSESDDNLTMDDLVKVVAEKEELLKLKHKEIEQMQDKVVRTYAEMENIMARTRREAENSKKFAIQNFAKGLLDVADNLGRASSVVKESFSKIDSTNDSAGAVPLLKTLLEGVEMTEKQLSEVLKKFGVEIFDPTNEPFDPHRHNAVFQVPDGSKPPGTVAAVLKKGYMLHERVLRPAEVGVTRAVENEDGA